MSGRKPKTLLFENPANVTATLSVNVTWFPATFGAVELGSFPLNLWLLRADAPTNEEIEVYAPFLLAQEQDVFNNSVLWTPTEADIDVDVPHAGVHQLSWEKHEDNIVANSSALKLKGFSKGFNIQAADSSNPSSSSTTNSPSITSTSSASVTASTGTLTIQPSSSNSGFSQGTIIGLAIGLGAPIIVGAALWICYHRRQKAKLSALQEALVVSSHQKIELEARKALIQHHPVEMDAERRY